MDFSSTNKLNFNKLPNQKGAVMNGFFKEQRRQLSTECLSKIRPKLHWSVQTLIGCSAYYMANTYWKAKQRRCFCEPASNFLAASVSSDTVLTVNLVCISWSKMESKGKLMTEIILNDCRPYWNVYGAIQFTYTSTIFLIRRPVLKSSFVFAKNKILCQAYVS